MNDRPVLDRNLDSKIFRDYYYLKEELVNFCRENGIPVSGGTALPLQAPAFPSVPPSMPCG